MWYRKAILGHIFSIGRPSILGFISGIRRPCWVLYKSVILGLMLGIYDHLWLDLGYRKTILGLILGIGYHQLYIGHRTAVLGLKLDIKSVIMGLVFGIYDHLGLDMG